VDIQVYAPKVRPLAIPVRILLPVGYSATPGRTYPLVLMLHGGNDDYTSWTRETDIEEVSAAYDAIVAMPDAGTTATYTNYLHPLDGNPLQWETFHTVELPQILEAGMHANANRAVAGLSSGGYGSFGYATRNPGRFRYAAAYSGPVAIRIPVVRTALLLSALDADPFARWGVPLLDEQNWRRNDPLTMAANLRGTGIYLSSGTTGLPSEEDTVGWTPVQVGEAFAGTIGRAFADRLKALGIPATVHFYTFGEHAWASWQTEMHTSYPLMMAAIGARKL
jgi:S-formylglutathione hydrolase FrmB